MTICALRLVAHKELQVSTCTKVGIEGLRPPSLLRPLYPLDLLHICEQLHTLDLFQFLDLLNPSDPL